MAMLRAGLPGKTDTPQSLGEEKREEGEEKTSHLMPQGSHCASKGFPEAFTEAADAAGYAAGHDLALFGKYPRAFPTLGRDGRGPLASGRGRALGLSAEDFCGDPGSPPEFST